MTNFTDQWAELLYSGSFEDPESRIRNPGSRIPEFQNSRIPEFQNSRIPEFQNPKIQPIQTI